MKKYEVTGKVVGIKRGAVVEFDTLPRAFLGRVRELPGDLNPKQAKPAENSTKR